MCSSTSASRTSSSVARKLATRWCGSLRMNPTVSETRARQPSPEIDFAGEGIESGEEPVLDEDLVLTREHAQHARLAGVGVADQRHVEQRRASRPEHLAVAFSHSRSFSRSSWIFLRIIRRSVSSWVSPGPRRPIPPRIRDRWVHIRASRGSRYSELRQLDLQLGLVGPGPGREDVEDQLGAVHHPDLELLLQVGALIRRQLLVEEHQGAALRLEQPRAAPRPSLHR